jgi:hypothetical protein
LHVPATIRLPSVGREVSKHEQNAKQLPIEPKHKQNSKQLPIEPKHKHKQNAKQLSLEQTKHK